MIKEGCWVGSDGRGKGLLAHAMSVLIYAAQHNRLDRWVDRPGG